MRSLLLNLFFFSVLATAYAQEVDSVDVVKDISAGTEDSTQQENIVYELERDSVHQTISPGLLHNTREYQAQEIAVHKFDHDKWKEVVGTTDYEEKSDEAKNSDEKKKSKAALLWNSGALRIAVYVLIAAVILYLLYYFSVNLSPGNKLNKQKLSAQDVINHVENIEDLDIQKWLQQALADGNLRLAVRICYLGLLKKLNEHGSISWKKNKTNQDYLSELLRKDFHVDEVTRLTCAYEQVWYGEHTLTKESFAQLFASFETMENKINIPGTL